MRFRHIIWMLACTASCHAEVRDSEPIVTEDADSIASSLAAVMDSSILPAIAGQDGWNYQEVGDVDLTGDGLPERVVLTAQVEMYQGRPAWDDGQAWQAYAVMRDGRRAYFYAQRLQLGTARMRIAEGENSVGQTAILLEQLPARLRIIELAAIDSLGRPGVKIQFERALDPRGPLASPDLSE